MKKKITKKIDITVNGNSFEIDASELSIAIEKIEEANRGKKTMLSIKSGDKKLTISATIETEDDGEKGAKYKVESGGALQVWHSNSISDEEIDDLNHGPFFYKKIAAARKQFKTLAGIVADYFGIGFDELLEENGEKSFKNVTYLEYTEGDESGWVELTEIQEK